MPSRVADDGDSPERTLPDDLVRAHAFVLDHVRRPGTWLDGAARVAVAREARRAVACDACRRRKASLSPAGVDAEHEGVVAAAVHRIRTDPGRLSRAWFDDVVRELGVETYVELVALTAFVAGLDAFARARGVPPAPIPDPLPGEPSRHRPSGAAPEGAWVPMVAPEAAVGPEAGLYGDAPIVPNIVRALSLVPDEARALRALVDAHYVPVARIPDPTARRALDRAQIELVAARVSALNECFY